MRKLMITLVFAPLLFASCNKKLKEEIKDLDGQINDLKSKNQTLENQLNTASSAIGSNEPITATTTFTDDNNQTRTWSDTYYFKASNYSTQYMEDNGDGTFDIYIERFSDVDWNEEVWLSFNYTPSSGTIGQRSLGHSWDWNQSYNDYAYYYSYLTGCTINISLSSINVTTGDISLSVTATGDASYAANSSNLPNNDQGATTTFSFSGRLKVYPEN